MIIGSIYFLVSLVMSIVNLQYRSWFLNFNNIYIININLKVFV